MKWGIIPYVGVGDLEFGMATIAIRNLVAEPFTSFLKTPLSKHPTDNFRTLGLHVYYDINGCCEAFEIGTPGTPSYHDKEIIGQQFSEIKNWFGLLDSNFIVDTDGITFPKLGMAIYIPSLAKIENPSAEGVLIYRKNYFD